MPEKTVRQAFLDAADWLEANPDRHIAGYLAADKQGARCTPLDPDAACFCGVGRVAKELNLLGGASLYARLDAMVSEVAPKLTENKSVADNIVGVNDTDPRKSRTTICHVQPGNQRVIAHLRKVAKRLPE